MVDQIAVSIVVFRDTIGKNKSVPHRWEWVEMISRAQPRVEFAGAQVDHGGESTV
jgi:hypothetical protein